MVGFALVLKREPGVTSVSWTRSLQVFAILKKIAIFTVHLYDENIQMIHWYAIHIFRLVFVNMKGVASTLYIIYRPSGYSEQHNRLNFACGSIFITDNFMRLLNRSLCKKIKTYCQIPKLNGNCKSGLPILTVS